MADEMDSPNPLSDLRRRIDEGLPHIELTVRELLELFNAKRRGAWIVEQILSALESSKLTTDPDFRDSWIDGVVRIKPQPKPPVESPVAGKWGPDGDTREEPLSFKATTVDPVQRVRMLPAANKPVAFVAPDDDISVAITMMMKDEYSQLSVQIGERTVKGVVSWKSIASRIALGLDHSKVRNCIELHQEVRADDFLFDVIPVISAHGYVLVRGSDQKISGIITATDLSEQFRDLTQPFLLLGQIEQHIRKLLDGNIFLDDLRAVSDWADPNKLTLGDYIRLMANEGIWEKLGMPYIDRASVIQDLERVREIRNDVMHFNPDPLDYESLRFLTAFSKFLRTLDEIRGK